MSKRRRIYLVAGARPNFMKIAPLWHVLEARQDRYEVAIVHTGQHYDYVMSEVFFKNLKLPEPHYFLDVGSGTHGYQTAEVLKRFEDLAMDRRPHLVVVVGDVNSTIAAALASVKLGILVAHVEAGLRSFDMAMPEEVNRILTDRISDLLFVSEPSGLANLAAEGIDKGKIHLVGNLMIDSLKSSLEEIRARDTAEKMGLKGDRFGLVTLHRPSNVDAESSLRQVLAILREAASRGKLVFPAHPRTRKSIDKHGLKQEFAALDNVTIIEPVGYFDFANLMIHCSYVLTDSGGIQEETTWLGIPCITLRKNTERPLTVEQGTNRITGLDLAAVKAALDWARSFDASAYSAPELWDGHAAERVVKIVDSFVSAAT
jgi:UDP-N-acetylglucosamine 2-epimerase (non-hydrolysing)